MRTATALSRLKLVCIVGPTASGKSALAVELARAFNGVVISADSRQIYKGMDVGTTKITKSEMHNIPHYMLSIVEPNEEFNAGRYQKTVMNLLERIAQKNQKLSSPVIPMLVGGTGLYIRAVVDGLKFSNVQTDKALRVELESRDLASLVAELLRDDPTTTIDIKNKRRVVRALEILRLGGSQPSISPPPFQVLKIGLGKNKEQTVSHIKRRVYALDLNALVKETKKLIRHRYRFDLPAMTALGYRDVKELIDKKISEGELINRLTKLHLAYAKRQMTWFKKDPSIHWVKTPNEAEQLVSQFLFE